MTSPAASGRGTSGSNGSQSTAANFMEQLIQLQSQLATPASHGTIASV